MLQVRVCIALHSWRLPEMTRWGVARENPVTCDTACLLREPRGLRMLIPSAGQASDARRQYTSNGLSFSGRGVGGASRPKSFFGTRGLGYAGRAACAGIGTGGLSACRVMRCLLCRTRAGAIGRISVAWRRSGSRSSTPSSAASFRLTGSSFNGSGKITSVCRPAANTRCGWEVAGTRKALPDAARRILRHASHCHA